MKTVDMKKNEDFEKPEFNERNPASTIGIMDSTEKSILKKLRKNKKGEVAEMSSSDKGGGESNIASAVKQVVALSKGKED